MLASILDWSGIGQYIQDALVAVVSWLSDQIATALLAVIADLPKLPDIDWTPVNDAIGIINGWVPMDTLTECVGSYMAWWLVWSVLRITLKIIWSG